MTKRTLRNVAKVVAKDCDLIDWLMTKYSMQENSKADDLLQVPFKLDEFEVRVSRL